MLLQIVEVVRIALENQFKREIQDRALLARSVGDLWPLEDHGPVSREGIPGNVETVPRIFELLADTCFDI